MLTAYRRLVVGAAQLGQQYGRSGKQAPDDVGIEAILRAAAKLGCAGIDTARAYGDSEAAIGRARRAGAGADVPLLTKVRPLTDQDEATGIEAAVAASVEESLRQLGAERLDAVLLHRAEDLLRGRSVVARALTSALEDGLISRWGVSVADPDELATALATPGVGYIQLPFNIVDRRWLADEVQDVLAAHPEVTIVARSAFLQGVLLHPDDGTWPGTAGPSASLVRSGLTAISAQTARSFAGLCLGYVLAQPWIDAVVVGVRTARQLTEVARECEPPLSPEECEQLESVIPPGSRTLVNPALWPQRERHAP
jgi:spore coat polysaccharide biosynthesis protein SpsF